MTDPLEDIRQSSEAISNTKFEPAGIFTNAMLSGLDIPNFVRDCLATEMDLYQVVEASGVSSSMVLRKPPVSRTSNNKSAFVYLKPERIDGESLISETGEQENDRNAVHIPSLLPANTSTVRLPSSPEPFSSPTRKRIASHLKLIPKEIVESDNVRIICEAIEKIVDQHPGMKDASQLKSRASAARQEYNDLMHDIETLEDDVAETQSHLENHYGPLVHLSPSRGGSSPSRPQNIEEYIEAEEQRISNLEKELYGSLAN